MGTNQATMSTARWEENVANTHLRLPQAISAAANVSEIKQPNSERPTEGAITQDIAELVRLMFPKLPLELQHRIWMWAAYEPQCFRFGSYSYVVLLQSEGHFYNRRVQYFEEGTGQWVQTYKIPRRVNIIPGLFLASHESRKIALEHCSLQIIGNNGRFCPISSVRYAFQFNRLRLDPGPHLFTFVKTRDLFLFQTLRFIEVEQSAILHPYRTLSLILDTLMDVLPNLRKLTIVHTQNIPTIHALNRRIPQRTQYPEHLTSVTVRWVREFYTTNQHLDFENKLKLWKYKRGTWANRWQYSALGLHDVTFLSKFQQGELEFYKCLDKGYFAGGVDANYIVPGQTYHPRTRSEHWPVSQPAPELQEEVQALRHNDVEGWPFPSGNMGPQEMVCPGFTNSYPNHAVFIRSSGLLIYGTKDNCGVRIPATLWNGWDFDLRKSVQQNSTEATRAEERAKEAAARVLQE